jgi:maltooligosyltrehalose trehalohydrolase
VACVQNHDQVGNRARGERLPALVSPAACRLAAGLLLLAPHVPMLFMGEEYREDRPFLFFCSFGNHRLVEGVRQGRRRDYGFQGEVPDPQAESTFAASRLSWSWPEGSDRAGLRRLYADLLTARRQWAALRDFTHRAARLLPDAEHGPILELIRGGAMPEAGKTVQAYFNLSPEPRPLPDGVARGAVLFSSEAREYAGARNEGTAGNVLLPHECLVFSG